MSRSLLAIILLWACPFAVLASSPPPDLSQSLRDLNNLDPMVRDNARQALMSLTRPRLDALRQAVAKASPLSPEQITALHEIVMQVMLSDAAVNSASADSNKGFLGAKLDQCQAPGADGAMRPAILVFQCIPGFNAYRMLQTDDIILAIDGDAQPARDVRAFTAAVQSHVPGQHISLQILRGGRITQVTLELSPRPLAADNTSLPDLLENQRTRVEQYWQTNFEPLLRKSR